MSYQSAQGTSLVLEHEFDGGAASYFGVGIGAFLLTVCTLGFATPWAICMTYRWKAQHTLINGQRVRFSGTGAGLFGHWVKWWLLTLITFGIYSFWVQPRLTKWIVEHYQVAVQIPVAFVGAPQGAPMQAPAQRR